MTWTTATALQVLINEDSKARIQAFRQLSIAQLDDLRSDLADAHRGSAHALRGSKRCAASSETTSGTRHRNALARATTKPRLATKALHCTAGTLR